MLGQYLTKVTDWKRRGMWFHSAGGIDSGAPLSVSDRPLVFTCPMCRDSIPFGLKDMIPTKHRLVMPQDAGARANDRSGHYERELQSTLRRDREEWNE